MKYRHRIKRSQRGAATVIGMVLFLALVVLAVAFMQEIYFTQSSMIQKDNERLQENIVITAAYRDYSGHLIVNMTNRGGYTATIMRLWVHNQTDNQQFNIPASDLNASGGVYRNNTQLDPGVSISYITNALMTSGQDYAISLVTARGNTASYNIVHGAKAGITIYAPSTTLIGHNTTIFLSITNNDTSNNNIYDLIPKLAVTPASSLLLLESATPANVSLLPVGSTAIFRYVYKVTGSGLTIKLNGTFTNALQGNWHNFTIYATTLNVAGEITTMPIFRFDSVGSIPALLDSNTGVATMWGIAFVNPYNRSVYVYSAAVISSSFPLFQSNLVGVNPNNVGSWDIKGGSGWAGVFWEAGAGSPIEVPAYSAYNFTFKVEVEASQGAAIETPVYIEAISSEGKYVKVMTTSVDNTFPSINLYYTRLADNPLVDYQYSLVGVRPGTRQTYNVTVYNSGTRDLTSRYRLLVLVPAGWMNVSISDQAGWLTPSKSELDDGSTSISVMSSGTMLAAGGYAIFQFEVDTPEVSSATLYTIATTVIYPDFEPSITAAYCSLAVQVVP